MRIAKQASRPDWDEYFIEIAKVVSSRSTCLRRRYGAVIVKDHVIIGTGYNGAPRGYLNCIETGRCTRKELNIPSGQRYELCEAVHAEQNAIISGQPERMKDSTIYIAGFEEDGGYADSRPCLLCSRMIVNAQIKKVVFIDKQGKIKKMTDMLTFIKKLSRV
ncbi:MAG: dCMP deaminase family protein [Nitrospirae bacterium]|nr:dCMP deaminase family protein [Nitrospirota bacterium]